MRKRIRSRIYVDCGRRRCLYPQYFNLRIVRYLFYNSSDSKHEIFNFELRVKSCVCFKCNPHKFSEVRKKPCVLLTFLLSASTVRITKHELQPCNYTTMLSVF
jgi:hypothetical protein